VRSCTPESLPPGRIGIYQPLQEHLSFTNGGGARNKNAPGNISIDKLEDAK
jgi:hypothetical protein